MQRLGQGVVACGCGDGAGANIWEPQRLRQGGTFSCDTGTGTGAGTGAGTYRNRTGIGTGTGTGTGTGAGTGDRVNFQPRARRVRNRRKLTRSYILLALDPAAVSLSCVT